MQDCTTGEGGLLQVCLEGVGLLFATSKVKSTLTLSYFSNLLDVLTLSNEKMVTESFVPLLG